MTIELMTQEVYDELCAIQKETPSLTYNFKGYGCFDRDKFNSQEVIADRRINEILNKHIHGFRYFQNFCTDKEGEICVRLQYAYSDMFTGVGYLKLTELLNGFN